MKSRPALELLMQSPLGSSGGPGTHDSIASKIIVEEADVVSPSSKL